MKTRTLLLLAVIASLLPGLASAGERFATCIIRDASGRPHRAVVRVNDQGLVAPRVVRTTQSQLQATRPDVRQAYGNRPVSGAIARTPANRSTAVYQAGGAYSSANFYYRPSRYPDVRNATYLSSSGVCVRPFGRYPVGYSRGYNYGSSRVFGYGNNYGANRFHRGAYCAPAPSVTPSSIYYQIPRYGGSSTRGR